MTNAVESGRPIISLKGVSKSYRMGDSRIDVLKGINLEMEQGGFIALEGPSGSGKSTLLNLCGLIDRADAGRIVIDQSDATDMSETELTLFRREKIGFVFQGFNLVPVMTAFENVEYPLLINGLAKKARKERVNHILEKTGLADMQSRRPDQLSGGQRQRVAIARALVKNPRLVIADEPTANLDSNTASLIIDLMYQLGATFGSTFLIATHDARMTRHCNQVIRLADGVIQ